MGLQRGALSATNGVVLTDFDTAYTNRHVDSRWDDASNVDLDAITAAAAMLARAVNTYGAAPAAGTFAIDKAQLRAYVDQLAQCFLTASPGLACPLAAALVEPGFLLLPNGTVSFQPRTYMGPLQARARAVCWRPPPHASAATGRLPCR